MLTRQLRLIALAAMCVLGVTIAGSLGIAADAAKTQPSRHIKYYRNPMGLPDTSPVPKKDSMGMDYIPVYEDENGSDAAKPAEGGAAKDHSSRRIKYYRNPMGLPDTSPVPKKDSMGMDYIPVYEDESSADDGSVKLSAGKIQKSGVRSETAEMRTLQTTVRAPGTVAEDERRSAVVALRFEGFIDKVENVTTGDHVHKGQPLMTIYGPALSSAAAEYVSALNGALSAQALKGVKRRLQNLGAPAQAIAEMERTREIPITMTWPAPQDGEIVERKAVDGMRAAPGDILFRIEDHRMVWVIADVAESDLALIAPGQNANVRLHAYPDKIFRGKVALIYPHLKAQTRTAQIRIELPNPDELLRPEMYAAVEIETGSKAPVLTVSNSAVIDSGDRRIVLVDKGDGRFEPRAVKVGRQGDGHSEIRNGLAEGDRVVVSANFLIDAESNLKAALQGFDSAEKAE